MICLSTMKNDFKKKLNRELKEEEVAFLKWLYECYKQELKE